MTYREPKVFLTYAWESEEHKQWVKDFATRLRSAAGIEVILDEWEVRLGEPFAHFMEKSVRESDFVICVCTPAYKKRFDDREGGTGFEAHIMTAETLQLSNQRKFIPLVRTGDPLVSLPTWLLGNRFIDFRGDPYSEEHYEYLISALYGISPQAPPVRQASARPDQLAPDSITRQESYSEFLTSGFKVFEQGKCRLLLLAKNNYASRLRLPEVIREQEAHFERVKILAVRFGVESSNAVKTAAGPMAVFVNLAMVFSHHPDLSPKFEEAHAQFNEALPTFIKAVREEGGLR
ncbi:MAG TPA: toll/interleukin-1 receptor domain-containing protein [Thermoanaerobaculia bacterium]|jgi:hypothetical protein|nr:toll/interleukin-1 receptor domain-containing protein [Thermoanaerobaculia bacterium]